MSYVFCARRPSAGQELHKDTVLSNTHSNTGAVADTANVASTGRICQVAEPN